MPSLQYARTMSFSTPCNVSVQLGDPSLPPISSWDARADLTSLLDPVLALVRGTPSVAVGMFDGIPLKEVRLGRLTWSDGDRAKWLLGSPINQRRSRHWRFGEIEIWGPNPHTCSRRRQPPDFYLKM